MKSKETGLYWIKDLKTTGMYVDDGYFSGWALGGQGGYYSWLVGEDLGHENIGGVIVDVVSTKKKGTDESDVKRKIFDSYEVEWQGFEEVVREWLWTRDRGVWRRSESACVRYNKKCPYWLPCKYGESEHWVAKAGLRRKSDDEWHR